MKYEWLEDFISTLKGTEKVWQPDWKAYKYMIGDKMFVMEGEEKDIKPIITLKLLPENGIAMRNAYEAVFPGYYMNKEHWNSIYRDGDVPDDIVKEMITESYNLILKSMSKKKQKEILGE